MIPSAEGATHLLSSGDLCRTSGAHFFFPFLTHGVAVG
jgi:hypothetical protein